MAVADQTEGSTDRSVVIRLPHWIKILTAFIAGGALVAASLVQFVPRGLTRLGTGAPGEEGFFSEEGEIFPGEAGDLGGALGTGGGGRRLSTSSSGGGSGTAGRAGRAGGTSGRSSSAGGGGTGSSGGSGSGAIECKAGRNGGATAKGVTGTSIKLATTAVLDGEAASLLRDSVTGIRAAIQKVNRAGGVCGRSLSLAKVDNDGFDAQRGLSYIRNYAEADYFALPVVPSAEGLGAAIKAGLISEKAIPVVGTDGMRQEQYGVDAPAEWVWPVAAATISTMRIMAKYGKEKKGAQTFAIVWDGKYKFGEEGHEHFIDQVTKKMGGDIVSDIKLNPDDPNYSGQVQTFNNDCGGGKCDMVALLLLPDTAKKWLKPRPALGRLYTSGAQTLFNDRFAQDCVQALGEACHGVAVWTGYNPPVGSLASLPGVSDYVNDVKSLNPNIDVRNQFLQGAYLGMSVFVEGLRKVGPQLTRQGLKDALDSMDYQTDLAATLTWRPGNHWANVQAQGFSMNVSGGTFYGWSNDQTGWIRDPTK